MNGLDHKLGSLLIEEELKMKDSLIHALKVLKDELQHEIFNTQVRLYIHFESSRHQSR